jgi:hypothetical protein
MWKNKAIAVRGKGLKKKAIVLFFHLGERPNMYVVFACLFILRYTVCNSWFPDLFPQSEKT